MKRASEGERFTPYDPTSRVEVAKRLRRNISIHDFLAGKLPDLRILPVMNPPREDSQILFPDLPTIGEEIATRLAAKS